MMEVFSIRARAAIQIAIENFGTPLERSIWSAWAANHPEIRLDSGAPRDDGEAPMENQVRETIIVCLLRRHEYMSRLIKAPLTTADDAIELSNHMSHLYAIVRRLSHNPQEWPSGY